MHAESESVHPARDDSPPDGFAATTNMMMGTIQIFPYWIA